MNHLFDGFSVLHLFTVSNGRATYRSRILKSESYLTSKAANRLTIGQFGMTQELAYILFDIYLWLFRA